MFFGVYLCHLCSTKSLTGQKVTLSPYFNPLLTLQSIQPSIKVSRCASSAFLAPNEVTNDTLSGGKSSLVRTAR